MHVMWLGKVVFACVSMFHKPGANWRQCPVKRLEVRTCIPVLFWSADSIRATVERVEPRAEMRFVQPWVGLLSLVGRAP